jgi:ABC-2 type transport system ATP-binding protein
MYDIVVKNLTKTYGTKKKPITVVSDISFSVEKGTAFGFIGPNGAGKTSTIKMLVGLSHPTSGTIQIAGGKPEDIDVRTNIGFMPESPQFYQYLTGKEFLEFAATLFGISTTSGTVIDSVLAEVNLSHAKNKRIRTYSKGMLQRLGLAQALINNPRVLFLDEPLDGLDALGRAEVKKIILNLKKQGKTIFINTHILADVAEICDTVGICDLGKIIAQGKPSELSSGYKDLEDAFVSIIHEERKKGNVHVPIQ